MAPDGEFARTAIAALTICWKLSRRMRTRVTTDGFFGIAGGPRRGLPAKIHADANGLRLLKT